MVALFFGACVLAVIFRFSYLTATNTPSSADKANFRMEMESEVVIDRAKMAVKKRLRSPATAKFPGTFFGRGEYKVYLMPGGCYRVTSWVDSQNRFGALIRSEWVVDLEKKEDRWEAKEVVVE